AAFPFAAFEKTLTIDQSLNLINTGNPRISADIHLVAYQVQETNWEEKEIEIDTWIEEVATAERYQLTNAKKSSYDHAYSPDTKEKKAEPVRLTEGTSFTVSSINWSPDGEHLAFSATKDPDLGSSYTADIYVLKVSDKSLKKIVETKGPDNNPVWSPDSKQ